MRDRELTYNESLALIIGMVVILVIMFGGMRFVRSNTTICNRLPQAIVDACWGR